MNPMQVSVALVAFLAVGIGVYMVFDPVNHKKPSSQTVSVPQEHKKTTGGKVMSKKVTIYTTQVCPYCVKAKKLLESKGIPYEEIDVGNDNDARLTMIEKAGGKTSVPQIFIGDTHVGGADDLYDLHGKGQLDPLLVE